MTDPDFKELQPLVKKLEDYKASPGANAWARLDNRLEHKRNRRRIRRFKLVSIAASLLALLSVVTVMSLYLKEHNPDLFAASHVYEPVKMEAIDHTSDEFYKIEHIDQISEAYASLGITTKKLFSN